MNQEMKTLSWLKCCWTVDKEGVFAYISIMDSHQNISKHVKTSIISIPTTCMVESGFLTVVNVFSRKINKC